MPQAYTPILTFIWNLENGQGQVQTGTFPSQSSGDTLWNRMLSEVAPSYVTKRELASGISEVRAQWKGEGQGEACESERRDCSWTQLSGFPTRLTPWDVAGLLTAHPSLLCTLQSLPRSPSPPGTCPHTLLLLKPHSSVEYKKGQAFVGTPFLSESPSTGDHSQLGL